MKQFIVLSLISIAAMLNSCNTGNARIIDNAEQLVANGNIDSALIVIDNILSPEKMDKHQQARYALIVGQIHSYKGEAMSEDSLLRVALDYYSSATPTDSAKLLQSTILAAKHYWWIGDNAMAYEILENSINNTNRLAILMTLCELASMDYDLPRMNKYLFQLLDIDNGNNDMSFIVRYNLGLTTYYMGNPEAADIALNGIEKYARLPQDTATYWKLALRSQADIASDMGNQMRAIELQNKALKHFEGDSTEMAFSYASLSRYYLLMGKTREAENYLRIADKMATDEFRNDLSYSGYCQILHILIEYAKTRNFDFKEWATFVNQLQDNAMRSRKITEAKERTNHYLA